MCFEILDVRPLAMDFFFWSRHSLVGGYVWWYPNLVGHVHLFISKIQFSSLAKNESTATERASIGNSSR